MFTAFKFTDCCLICPAFVKAMEFLSIRIEIKSVDQNIHSRLPWEYRLQNLGFYIILKYLFQFLEVYKGVG